MDLNKNMNESLKDPDLCDDQNNLEEHDKENFQEISETKLHINEDAEYVEDEEGNKEKNENLANEEEKGQEHNSFLQNVSLYNNTLTSENPSREYTDAPNDELINAKQQNGEGNLLFDKNENEEILENSCNITETKLRNDSASEEGLRKKKEKKKKREREGERERLKKNKNEKKLNKKKRNVSDNESDQTKNDDAYEKPLKKKKKTEQVNENKFIDNAADEGEEGEEGEENEAEEEQYTGMNNDNYINKKKKHNYKNTDYNDAPEGEDEYGTDKDDSNKLQKKKKNHFDEILENLKFRKKKTPKISEDEGLQFCENILNQMILVHEQDMKNMKEKKPATSKLQIIDQICKILTKPKWKPFFMKLNIYHVLALWLIPTSKNSLPNFTIRTNILKVIQQLPITIKSLRGSQLGKIMTYMHSHKDEVEENKKLIKNILQKWMGPVIGINTNYKQFLKERQKKIMENPEYHKKVLEKAKTLIPESISIEKEEEQNELKRHATIPYNSECSFLINVPSSIPVSNIKNIPKSKIKRLADSMKLNKSFRKSQKVSIEGKGVAVAP